MTIRRWLMLLSTLLLTLALAACRGGDQAAKPAPRAQTPAGAQAPAARKAASTSRPSKPKPKPTPTPKPPTPTPKPPTPTPTTEPIEELSSTFQKIEDAVHAYRSRGTMDYVISGMPEEGDMHVTMEFTSEWVKADNPAGYDVAMTLSMSGVPEADSQAAQAAQNGMQQMEIRMIGDTAYLKLGDQWITTPRSDVDSPDTMTIDVEDFIQGMKGVQRVGEENVNGIDAIHYTFNDIANYDELLKSILEQQLKEEHVSAVPTQTQVQGDLWVAKDGGYPVKSEMIMSMSLQITRQTADGQQETLPVEFRFETSNQVYDVNSDIVIRPPEGVSAPGQIDVPGFEPGAFPMPEKTDVQGAFGGMTTLMSQLSADEIAAFYDQALTELGWSKGDGFMPVWTKGNFSFTMIITPNDDGTTAIVIMPSPRQ